MLPQIKALMLIQKAREPGDVPALRKADRVIRLIEQELVFRADHRAA
jgi:hypothetical protein